ncbi:tyrosinase family protein [Alisedimentitalea sp. MJ-SS2]|uniref:tyrosinase family protein n=1 Tax=Aliisedimentitalea sp. MJ-SS2 TaxID=3049795 RepID=UPI0029149397|nr:tyrosinase family protein [Alisedimentitalea sp. MJ-SS2]MDU8929931.1 tyrosinase family protein [Alisedimentitalea sp. MJ-SS2]
MTLNLTPTRRGVLKGAAASAAILATPGLLTAQGNAKFLRKSMTDPNAASDMDSYRRAVAVMWTLPPDHPHNWFRMAMTHLLDCPHGNWWFFVWHRGYLGYFEQVIRLYSKDDGFALPYWDWSADSFVANSMFSGGQFPDNALDPTSQHFPADWATFDAAYQNAVSDYWNTLNAAQLHQEQLRGNPNFNAFYSDLQSNFTTPRQAGRSKTPTAPNLTGNAEQAVQPQVIMAGLQPVPFTTVSGSNPQTGFNSPESANHHMGVGSAIIEGFPHNQVHNNLGGPQGGWMPSLLSSVDPIFFLHHCNVDRLWDVWTRKQIANGDSAEPTPQEQVKFYPEEFLFFHDADGNPVLSTTTAKDYMGMARWDYAYTDGAGSGIVPKSAGNMLVASAKAAGDGVFSENAVAKAGLDVSPEFVKTIEGDRGAERHIAHISFQPPEDLTNARFNFYLSPKGKAPDTSPRSPEFAGSFEFFGMGKGHPHPHTITLDISDVLDRMEAADLLTAGAAVDVSVVAVQGDGVPRNKSAAGIQGTLNSVSIETI